MHTTKLKRGLLFTDLHYGKKSNSPLHNSDCTRFVSWICDIVRKENIDYVAFLGDWNENRSALNVGTLQESYIGAKMLNDLGLPIYFCVGNHDLYHRHTREVYSVIPFTEFTNFVMINEPTVIDDIEGSALFCPYLFDHEYDNLSQYNNIPFWAGHFEFNGFQITAHGTLSDGYADPNQFDGPTHIISGHFHKRQSVKNIHYMGNCFPMDFGDAGDLERGCMIYDHTIMDMTYYNWEDCPKYTRLKLSDILDGTAVIYPDSRVKCLIDVPLSFEESTTLRHSLVDEFKLREFAVEESYEISDAITDNDIEIDPDDIDVDSVDDLVIKMLRSIDTDHIDNDLLIKQYQRLG